MPYSLSRRHVSKDGHHGKWTSDKWASDNRHIIDLQLDIYYKHAGEQAVTRVKELRDRGQIDLAIDAIQRYFEMYKNGYRGPAIPRKNLGYEQDLGDRHPRYNHSGLYSESYHSGLTGGSHRYDHGPRHHGDFGRQAYGRDLSDRSQGGSQSLQLHENWNEKQGRHVRLENFRNQRGLSYDRYDGLQAYNLPPSGPFGLPIGGGRQSLPKKDACKPLRWRYVYGTEEDILGDCYKRKPVLGNISTHYSTLLCPMKVG